MNARITVDASVDITVGVDVGVDVNVKVNSPFYAFAIGIGAFNAQKTLVYRKTNGRSILT